MGRTGCRTMASSLTCTCVIGLGWRALMSLWLNWNGAPTISMEYKALASRRKFPNWWSLNFWTYILTAWTALFQKALGAWRAFVSYHIFFSVTMIVSMAIFNCLFGGLNSYHFANTGRLTLSCLFLWWILCHRGFEVTEMRSYWKDTSTHW